MAKGYQVRVSLFAIALLMGVCYYFFSSDPTGILLLSNPLSAFLKPYSEKECDLFVGKWIQNPSGPAYTNTSCMFISTAQNCMGNGRPDMGYLYWKWKPRGCDLPPFDAKKFLNAMRGRSWAFVGDSLFRNHLQSFLCMLSQVEQPIETYHSKDYKNMRWYFPSHNLTLYLVWSPFLVQAEIFEDEEGTLTADSEVHLDILESVWTTQYHNFDYVVITGGQWFLKSIIIWENNKIIGCHYCPKKNLPELGLDYPYRKALRLVFNFIATSDHKPVVLFRTWDPSHFENGEWFEGGVCNRTQPYKEGEYNGSQVDRIMQSIVVEEFEKAAAIAEENGVPLRLMDTFNLSVLRPDGHPGPYRSYHPDISKHPQNDCLHWCLPGPVDIWNDLLMKMSVDEGDQLRYAI